MRFLRVFTAVIFTAVLALTLVFRLSVKRDTTKPIITVDTEVIEAVCAVSDEELLGHVSATDAKDGDLTDKVFVENISQFIDEGESNVTFCVSDQDNNVTKKTVSIVFTDYEKPELYLHDDLVFPSNSVINVASCATVTDKFDGDITDRLSVVTGDHDSDAKRLAINFKISNSKGYIYKWTIDAVRVSQYSLNPNYSINIGNHLMILNVGDEKPDFREKVQSITYMGEAYKQGRLKIDDKALDMKKPGTYDVWFNLYVPEKSAGANGKDAVKYTKVTRERLIVICEDNSK